MLTRRTKQQLVVYPLTSVRSCVIANWTSLSMVSNNVKGTVEAQKQYELKFFIAMEKGRPTFNLCVL